MKNIYINVPFCASYCRFCNFYKNETASYPEVLNSPRYADDVLAEIDLRQPQQGFKLESIYIGGGTPLRLPVAVWHRLLDGLEKRFDLTECEITLESNPENLSGFDELFPQRINRLSLGIQSFSKRLLDVLGRERNIDLEFLTLARKLCPILNVDFIFDIPSQTEKELADDIRLSLELKPDHMSWYSLEEKPGLFPGGRPLHSEDFFADAFCTISQQLGENGYSRYEISNYALAGSECAHNLCYWRNQPYLAVGPGAFGLTENAGKRIRYRNTKDVSLWMKQVNAGVLPSEEEEILTKHDIINEYVLTRLRLKEGLDLNDYQSRFKEDFLIEHQYELNKDLLNFSVQANRFFLTESGLLYYNSNVSRLMKNREKA